VFKLFVYLVALEKGMTPESIVDDTSVTLGTWKPGNYLYKPKGEVSLRHAFAHSATSVTIRLGLSVGLASVTEMARRLGVTAPLPDNMTIALGTGG